MPSLSTIFPGGNTVLNDIYAVPAAGANVTVQIIVGNGQNANSLVYVNGVKKNGPGADGVFVRSFDVDLDGVKPGDMFTISTTVYDINPATDMTDVILSLEGGVAPVTYPTLDCNAGTNGSVPYYVYIQFTEA